VSRTDLVTGVRLATAKESEAEEKKKIAKQLSAADRRRRSLGTSPSVFFDMWANGDDFKARGSPTWPAVLGQIE
jgi:hypothetical protein